MENFNELLRSYAELAVKVGINLQKNQTLVINASVDSKDFVRMIAEIAYKSGARYVHIEYNDEILSRITYLNAQNEEIFNEFSKHKAAALEEYAKNDAAFLSIVSSDPEILKGVDPSKISASAKARSVALKEYYNYIMNSDVSWSVISIPSQGWAKKVFPDLSVEDAVKKLWEVIFSIVRVDTDDVVASWKNHLNNLQEKVDFLNNTRLKTLHYKSAKTDLTIELPKDHLWSGGGEYTSKGTYFVANMPTEEVFTLPLRTGVNGTVTSTKPLNYGGNIINNFSLTFKDGKVVDFSADEGYENLKKLIETDEGSHYLGEVALVPFNSPISNSNIIFYNTLFDENASCHLAFGKAYPICIKGGTTMSEDELIANGVNFSLTHEDFMVGSEDLDILGTTFDGKEIQIFKNGNWAF
ncbi:MAG: aminopeptidase [Clostridiaceae bacterium]